MEKFINEFKEGDKINAELLLVNFTKGVSNAGAPYISLVLQDNTGAIEAKKWDIKDVDLQMLIIGHVYLFNADVIDYRGTLQLKIAGIQEVEQNSIDYTKFCLPAPIKREDMINRLNGYLRSFKDEDIKKIVNYLVENHYNDFINFPAAVRNHHEHLSGLLYHTLSMADIGDFLASYYDDVDRDMLIAGIILHDVGKTIELSGPIATRYTLEGRLIGHLVICANEIHEAAIKLNIDKEKAILLEHMILAHHGEKEYGSPVVPMTKEAFMLHAIDDLDAKMNMISKGLNGIAEGEFSPRLIAFDGQNFYKPKNKKQ